MKLLLDQGIARRTAEILRAAGFDAVHVAELGMETAEDETILTLGKTEGRIVATLDADFHALLALSNADSPSVIRIRVENLKSAEQADLLQSVLRLCEDDLTRGAMVTVQPSKLRVRALPLVKVDNGQP